jgi:hypothetical protein
MLAKPAIPRLQNGNALNHGLTDAWLFTEGTGTTARDLANWANPLTLSGTTWVPGRAGKCLSYDGSASYAVSTQLPYVGATFTIAAWVHPATAPASYTRIAEVSYSSAFFLGTSSDGTKFNFIVNGWNLDGCEGGATTVGLWQHVCGVFNNGIGYLYVNGVQVASLTGSSPNFQEGGYYLYIGRPTPVFTGGYWPGLIDDVRYWNVALTPTQVRSLYQSTYDEFRSRAPAGGFLYAGGAVTPSHPSTLPLLGAGLITPAQAVGIGAGAALARALSDNPVVTRRTLLKGGLGGRR